jgi:predicted phosphodiesterase
MRVATLDDLHGNLRALEAVLQEIPAEVTIVVGGDICAGGTHPSETLERLRALRASVLWLRGNADRELTPLVGQFWERGCAVVVGEVDEMSGHHAVRRSDAMLHHRCRYGVDASVCREPWSQGPPSALRLLSPSVCGSIG